MKTAYISHRLAEDKFVNVKYHRVMMMTSTKCSLLPHRQLEVVQLFISLVYKALGSGIIPKSS